MKKTSTKILVSFDAWTALEETLNRLPPQTPNLFVSGGALVDVDLKTDHDWALYHAAYALGWRPS